MNLIVDKLPNGLPNPVFDVFLKNPVPKSEMTQLEADDLRDILISTVTKMGGYGLSANQLGLNKRACVVKYKDVELFLLNPFIKERSKDGIIFFEGCLSSPKTLKHPLKTVRSKRVVVQTDNLGEMIFEHSEDKEEVSSDTMVAVIVQHEIDHLDGITMQQRIYSTTVVNKQTYGRNDKVLMKSPNGDLIEVKHKKSNEFFLKGYEVV